MGLEIIADKSKCIFMSRDQNAGRSHNVKTNSTSFGRLERFKHFGTDVTNQNFIQEEIKGRLKSGNAYCHSVQTRLSASLLSKNRRVGTLIAATIYLQLIQNRYMFRSFTVLQRSHQHCVQPVASDVEVVEYLQQRLKPL